MKYEMENNNNEDWLNKVPWYNTAICSSLYGSLFEDIIIHAITDRYNIIFLQLYVKKTNIFMKMIKAILEIGHNPKMQKRKY